MVKKIVVIAVIAIMLLGLLGLTGCRQNPAKFTEEEHIERISERIEKRFPEEKDFSVYPLFNKEDELTHFIVEFESGYFEFIMICNPSSFSFLGGQKSMYQLAGFNDYPWRRYIYKTDLTDIALGSDESKIFEEIYRYKSPFEEADIENECRYLLGGGIVAVKRDNKFLNLVSMNFCEDEVYNPSLNIDFPPTREFDL